jgi:MoxR-like ATPase
MNYQGEFQPKPAPTPAETGSVLLADRRDGRVYVYSEPLDEDPIVLAVNVALATGRPLLVRGPSGCGKSSLARSVARTMNWRYYEFVVTARSEARDLLWQFDTLRRLADAQIGTALKADVAYVEPGPLWWAVDAASAARRGVPEQEGMPPNVPLAVDPAERFADAPSEPEPGGRAVLLVDEIDKAESDFPNNLLVPLGSYEFRVQETGHPVRLNRTGKPPLLIISTNDERDLPAAFQRRCVVLELPRPTQEHLWEIGKAHFPNMPDALFKDVTGQFMGSTATLPAPGLSVAEYLDAVRACDELKIEPGSPLFQAVARYTVLKQGTRGPGGA